MPDQPAQSHSVLAYPALCLGNFHKNCRLRCHLLDVAQAHTDVKPVELSIRCSLCTVVDEAGETISSVSKHGQSRAIGESLVIQRGFHHLGRAPLGRFWHPGEAAAELAVALDPPSNDVQLATSSTAIGAYPRAIQCYGNL